jgi:23S rRNA (cytidine2498-2'-O)-methyltransferase
MVDVDDVPVLFSAAEEYYEAAAAELRSAFADARVERLGSDLGRAAGAGLTEATLAKACTSRPLVFIRHIARQRAVVATDADAECVAAAMVDVAAANGAAGGAVSLQVWNATSPPPIRLHDIRAAGRSALAAAGYEVRRGNAELVLGVCSTADAALITATRIDHVLADWAGGRVSLVKRPEQISRSEFKLEELFKVFPLPVVAPGRAADLGASPGGWTRILRGLGHEVWAVDPAALDPRLRHDRGVHHCATTAGRFVEGNQERFDLVVNDLRMDPHASVAIMNSAADALAPGGLAIVTLKIGGHRPRATVTRSLETLRRRYEVLFARCLFHNRAEVTVVLRVRPGRIGPDQEHPINGRGRESRSSGRTT